MSRIVVINPNSDPACTAVIDAAIDPFRGPRCAVDVVGSQDGPPAILTWQDWHAAAGPLCRTVQRHTADAYLIACPSDPGLEAARALTSSPVLGIFRCAVAAALTRAERFGIVSVQGAEHAHHLLALRSMGVEQRLAGNATLDVAPAALLDPVAARGLLIDAAMDLAAAGAGVVVLACTGMAAHRASAADAAGVPLIEPCQAGLAMALLTLPG